MKILLVSTSSGSRGGGELALLYLGRALALRGHRITLWASDHPRMDELAAAFAGFGEVVRAPYQNTYDRRGRSLTAFLDGRTARRVAAHWRALAPDVVHINKQNLEDGLDLLAAARLSERPCLSMIHITQSARYLRAGLAAARDFVARRALQKFPGLLVTTPESRRRDLSKFLGETARICVVLNGVPIPERAAQLAARPARRGELGLTDQDLLIVGVGRMVAQKRPLVFLEMAERIHRAIPRAKFLWVGDGDLAAQWDARVAARGLESTVRRLPWQREIPPFLAAADVFMHVAEFEGHSFAILEALAAGLPCAISPNLLVEMPFLDSTNCLALSDDGAWLETLRDRARLRALGEAGGRLAEEKYSYAKMAEAYEALYEQTLGKA